MNRFRQVASLPDILLCTARAKKDEAAQGCGLSGIWYRGERAPARRLGTGSGSTCADSARGLTGGPPEDTADPAARTLRVWNKVMED